MNAAVPVSSHLQTSSQRPQGSRLEVVVFTVLLLVHLTVYLQTSLSESVTHDELWHLPVGVRNLRDGRFDVDRLNPPLSRMWAAIPLVVGGVDVNRDVTGSAVGKTFVESHPRTFLSWYHWGRLFHLLWTLVSALLVYLWARRRFSILAAQVSLLLYITCPNIAAHASLVTADAPSMCTFIATLYALDLWCAHPRWRSALVWGGALGLAQAVKFTGLLLYPLVFVLAAVLLVGTPQLKTIPVRRLAAQFVAALTVSIVILWGSYGFQGLFRPLSEFHFQSSELAIIQALLSPFPGLPVPLPYDYVAGIDEQRFIMQNPHPVFLDGQWSTQGFRSYYLKTLLYKLPHIFQCLVIVAVFRFCFWRNGPRPWRSLCLLWLPFVFLLGIAGGEGMQLGVRYVLPVLPLMMIFAGAGCVGLERWSSRARGCVAVALVVLCGLSLRYRPDHLAYFNEGAGGPIGGREHLLDSNLDWGQDLGELKNYLHEQGIENLGLAYFGTVPPQVVGIEFTLPPSWRPAPGVYAVSVNYVMGRPHVVTQGDGTSRSVDFQEFGYFRFFKPVTTLGGSIDVYQLTQSDVDAWESQLREAIHNHRG